MAAVLAARQPRETQADAAVAGGEIALVEGAELTDAGDAVGGEAALHRAADTPQPADRLVGEKAPGLGLADHRETARLVEVGGQFGEEFVVAEADRGGNAEFILDTPRQPGQQLRRRRAVQAGR